jgi:hypothetical protein
METEFYRSPTEVLPTFSLVLAVSLLSLHTPRLAAPDAASNIGAAEYLPACVEYTYYEVPPAVQEPVEQAGALKRFAENLLEETEDSPQEVVNALNQHFWDLV